MMIWESWRKFLSFNPHKPIYDYSKWRRNIILVHFWCNMLHICTKLFVYVYKYICTNFLPKTLKSTPFPSVRNKVINGFQPEVSLGEGDHPNLCSFRYPHKIMFHCIFKKEFSTWGFLGPWNLKKISQNFQTKFTISFSKSKNYHFSIQISSKSPCWSKFGQISSQKSKKCQFFFKTFIFHNFWRLRRRKCGVLGSFGTRFLWSWGLPFGPRSS